MSPHDILDPQKIILASGLLGVTLIIFAESGLFFGFFFPGDSLLFTARFLASQNYLPIVLLLISVFLAATIGDSVGYWFGKKTGPKLFTKEDSLFFKKEYANRAEMFYEEHGRKTIILARFMPIIRTFAPIVAGIGKMEYKTFLSYNVVGALLWSFSMTLLGYFLGKTIPNPDRYVLPIVILIVIISFLPPLFHLLRKKKL